MNKTDKRISLIFLAMFFIAMAGLGANIDWLFLGPMFINMILVYIVVSHQFMFTKKK